MKAGYPIKRKESAIESIGLAYRTGAQNIIPESEVKAYVKSIDFLEDVLKFSQTAFFIIEYNTWSYVYCSSNTKEVLGYSPEDLLEGGPMFGLKTWHDEDLEIQRRIHPIIIDFFSGLPESEKSRYRFSFTSRMIHGDGQEVILLQNNFFLKWNKEGKPLLKLMTFTDITTYKKNKEVVFYVTHIRENEENEVVMQKNFSGHNDIILSTRELEIVQLISSGRTVRDIAMHFSLSVNTVKNHKHNIIKKLGCTNSAQVVSLAYLYGLISNRGFNPSNKAPD